MNIRNYYFETAGPIGAKFYRVTVSHDPDGVVRAAVAWGIKGKPGLMDGTRELYVGTDVAAGIAAANVVRAERLAHGYVQVSEFE